MRRYAGMLAAIAWMSVGLQPVSADETTASKTKSYDETGRFYFYFQSGHAQTPDDSVVGDIEMDTPDGINVVLGGGGGYSFGKHWGLELQAHGTEPDLRSETRGKVKEFSNITIIPAARFRFPIGDGRMVPFITAGVGGSMNDVNDTGDPRIKLDTDDFTVAGSFGLGMEYFLSENVAAGFTFHTWIYPDQGTDLIVRDSSNRITQRESSSLNLSSFGLLAHLRLLPGQPASADGQQRRTLLFAENGPFDTADTRAYFYLMGGHTFVFSDSFGPGITLQSPGDFNATLGGALGVNLSERWGLELQLHNTDMNIEAAGGLGKIAEFSNFTILPMVRYRQPFCGGRFVPFVTAGLGAALYNINDARETLDIALPGGGAITQRTPFIDSDSSSLAANVGIGAEYFLNHHISFGVAIPLYLYTDVDTVVQKPKGPRVGDSANITGVGALISIRAYWP